MKKLILGLLAALVLVVPQAVFAAEWRCWVDPILTAACARLEGLSRSRWLRRATSPAVRHNKVSSRYAPRPPDTIASKSLTK